MTTAAATLILNLASVSLDPSAPRRGSLIGNRPGSRAGSCSGSRAGGFLRKESGSSLRSREWRREQTDDGRVYFFNRTTGASQWHIPNELYRSTFLDRHGGDCSKLQTTKMPGSARALFGIDCMVGSTMLDEDEMKRALLEAACQERRGSDFGVVPKHDDVDSLASERILRVRILRARGLRDADFMPGADKSDPYCRCEVPGKPALTFKTAVVPDCLDPVWNHEELVRGFNEGDTLELSVWDFDEPTQFGNCVPLYAEASSRDARADPANLWLDGDDCLGRCSIRDVATLKGGSVEYKLEDIGDHDEDDEVQDSFLSVDVRFVDAWPSLVGTQVEDAVIRLKRKRPDLTVDIYQLPDAGSPVKSVDMLSAQDGYRGSFFGVDEAAAEKLDEGSVIDVAGQKLRVSHIGPVKKDPRRPSEHVRCVFFHTPITGVIRDGEIWRKITRTPGQEGPQDDRVHVWYDYSTGFVAKIPYIG